jgi:S1-C subfamily serine protease
MPKTTPDEQVAVPTWQYWIARVMPMLYVTILTIALPTILSQSWLVSDLAATQEQKLHKHLRSISIKILAHGKTIGSGALVSATTQVSADPASSLANESQRVYTVVTNAHVIQAASAPFHLQTPDGQIYAAALVPPPTDQNRDLSILRFQSLDRTYNTAKLAVNSPKIGDRVWSAGFPLVEGGSVPDVEPTASIKPSSGLNIVKGQITQILPIAITGGYSIGSDRTIVKGMSGGPLINQAGELIGIDGVHANPLWDTPEVLEDGSTVSEALQEQIDNYSWAIPIEFVKNYIKL